MAFAIPGIVASGNQTPVCTYASLRSYTQYYSTSSSCAIPNKPSGTVEGDLMVCIVQFNADVTITPPTGWTEIDTDNGISTTASVSLFYKVAGASEPSNYLFCGSTTRVGAVLATFSGSFDSNPSNGTPVETQQTTTSSTDATADAMTLTSGCAMVLYLGSYDQASGATWTAPAGWTHACANSGTNVYIGYKTFAASGSTGSVGYTCSDTSSIKTQWLWSFIRNDT